MAKIAVIGLGQGGATCAIKLAEQGFEVCIFEKALQDEVGYEWYDDIRTDVFAIVNLPLPSADVYRQKGKWLFVSPNEKFSLPVPPCKPLEEISVSRRGLCKYFANLAQNAGCEVRFGCEVKNLIVENGKVCGVVSDGGEFRCDLVIDASGTLSKFRGQVPDSFGVQAMPDKDDVMCGYRAFFKPNEGADTLEKGIDCTMVLKHLGETGISWCNLNDDKEVDVLIGRVGALTDEQIENALIDLRALNPILSEELIREKRVNICLRNSIARPIADGYVAIGDSAFMTMPLMGSGIESSMKAGKLFADFVKKNNIAEFSAKNMWGFYREYMTKYGADFAFIDTLKRWALALDAETIDWVFGGGLIEKDDLALVSTDDSDDKPKISAKSVFKKVFLLLGHFGFVVKACKCISKCLKAKRVANKIPKEYDEKKLAKWAKKYNALNK